jgi:uncharacterized protein YfaA (DUF2138 family)
MTDRNIDMKDLSLFLRDVFQTVENIYDRLIDQIHFWYKNDYDKIRNKGCLPIKMDLFKYKTRITDLFDEPVQMTAENPIE